MIEIEPFSDLIFIYANGCGACEEALPEVDKLAASHPRLMIVKLQAGSQMQEALVPKRIRATPTYVFRRGGHGFMHEGMLTAKQIEKWIEKIVRSEETA